MRRIPPLPWRVLGFAPLSVVGARELAGAGALDRAQALAAFLDAPVDGRVADAERFLDLLVGVAQAPEVERLALLRLERGERLDPLDVFDAGDGALLGAVGVAVAGLGHL